MEYQWSNFNLSQALAGAVVGFEQETAYDFTYTGKLTETPATEFQWAKYRCVIRGNIIYADKTGNVKKVIGSGLDGVVEGVSVLKMPAVTFGDDSAIGGDVTRSSESGGKEGYTGVVNMTTMEPRDQFAVNALNAMLVHAEHPEDFDDTTMMRYSRAAYRWSQAMMIAAADSRFGTKEDEGGGGASDRTDVDVSSGTNTEKLLDNMVKAIDSLKTTVGGTLKVDNPADDKFKVDGAGGGASLNRDDVNDTGVNISDLLVYNTAQGKAPMRTTLANAITKQIATLSDPQKASLYTALRPLFNGDFSTAVTDAVNQAKAYTDSKIPA